MEFLYSHCLAAPHQDPEASILESERRQKQSELGVHGSVTQLIHSLEQYFKRLRMTSRINYKMIPQTFQFISNWYERFLSQVPTPDLPLWHLSWSCDHWGRFCDILPRWVEWPASCPESPPPHLGAWCHECHVCHELVTRVLLRHTWPCALADSLADTGLVSRLMTGTGRPGRTGQAEGYAPRNSGLPRRL